MESMGVEPTHLVGAPQQLPARRNHARQLGTPSRPSKAVNEECLTCLP